MTSQLFQHFFRLVFFKNVQKSWIKSQKRKENSQKGTRGFDIKMVFVALRVYFKIQQFLSFKIQTFC